MSTTFEELSLPGVILCRPRMFRDQRGYFAECFREELYAAHGVDRRFVQINQSFSHHGVVRGMHFQLQRPQAKLVSVLAGHVFDVVVDVRRASATFGKWVGVELSSVNGEQLFVPEGYAHGFCVLSENAHFMYQCSDYYVPGDEVGFHWASPEVAIRWPVEKAIVSDKDQALPELSTLPPGLLPGLDGYGRRD